LEERVAGKGREQAFRPVLRIRIRKDLYHFSGFRSVSYYNGTTKLTGRENLTKNTFRVGPVGPTDKENQVKMYKSTVLDTSPL
jgi:hypothetical protein